MLSRQDIQFLLKIADIIGDEYIEEAEEITELVKESMFDAAIAEEEEG